MMYRMDFRLTKGYYSNAIWNNIVIFYMLLHKKAGESDIEPKTAVQIKNEYYKKDRHTAEV